MAEDSNTAQSITNVCQTAVKSVINVQSKKCTFAFNRRADTNIGTGEISSVRKCVSKTWLCLNPLFEIVRIKGVEGMSCMGGHEPV